MVKFDVDWTKNCELPLCIRRVPLERTYLQVELFMRAKLILGRHHANQFSNLSFVTILWDEVQYIGVWDILGTLGVVYLKSPEVFLQMLYPSSSQALVVTFFTSAKQIVQGKCYTILLFSPMQCHRSLTVSRSMRWDFQAILFIAPWPSSTPPCMTP